MVILVCGLPGSGKSYFASRLAETIHAQYFNSDRLRKELFPKRTYSKSETAKVYEILLNKMEAAINTNTDLVLDATFHFKATRKPFISKGKGSIVFIEIQANEDVIRERLKEDRLFSEADLRVYRLIKEQWEALEQPHLTLQSTNDNIEAMLQKAVHYLKNEKRSN
ncbi:AAA family ATPase [Maribacter aestuarii]|uniref:AAA family ATPase n=1 Tax=Maribacter aestuarii TaxID=1130723 RepID=UPI00248AC025|nr:ATP-binding protein [Maribacter aestuarii]